jgi:XrtN system VIT domain protein
MKKVGADYFRHDYVQPQTIAEAEQGYIVSPVSSMIVLETAKDYERFGIDENKNSLKNASMKSSGAVPEPQEWMLIILAACIVGSFIYKRKKAAPQF